MGVGTVDALTLAEARDQFCPQDTFFVSPSFTKDSDLRKYSTIQDAIDDSSSGNTIVVYPGTYNLGSELSLSGKELTLFSFGYNSAIISRGAGNSIVTIGDDESLVLVGFSLVGSLDISSASAGALALENVILTGMIDIQTGTTETEIWIRNGTIITGDSTDKYAIRIDDADPLIYVDSSYLIGDSGDQAIYWNSDNSNVRLKYSVILHGDLGANNPLGRAGAITPDYYSHHCSYNDDPENGGIFTNLIAVGQRFDCLDANASY